MNRKIISFAVAAAMLYSQAAQAVPMFAADAANAVYSCDFSDEQDISAYSLYDSSNTEGSISFDSGLQRLSVSFGNNHGWNDSNGIKTDITKNLQDCAEGDKIKVSLDFTSTYWNDPIGKAKVFLEIANASGTKQIVLCEGPDSVSANDETAALTGETDAYAYSDGDTVYLCVTQASGLHYYDNINVAVEKPETNTDVILDDNFDNGYTDGYTVYDEANTEAAVNFYDGLIGVGFGDSHQWNDNNGIKKDITSLVTSGEMYTASVDVNAYWGEGNDTPAKLFFKVVGDNETVISIGENTGADGSTVTVSGTALLVFNEGDKVYICTSQPSGYHTYDNLLLKKVSNPTPTVTASAEPTPTSTPPKETAEPSPTLEPISDALFSDDFSAEEQTKDYTLYDTTNTTQGAGISIDGGMLVASMGTESWNSSNGIRRNITELVKQYISGVTFGVQFSMTAYWGDNNDVNADVFFETIGADGNISVTEIGTLVPQGGSDTAVMRGSAKLSYKEGDSIYLCVTQMSGNHRYDNVSMWLENPNDEGIIPLTSGRRYTGTYFPEQANAVFKNTFAGNAAAEIEAYKPYNDVAYTVAEPRDGGAFFEFPEGGTSTRGVTVDITDAIENNIPNGGKVRITCKMLPWWWWGSASLKVKSGDTITDVETYTAKTGDPGGVWAVIGDIIELGHTPGERVELIITMDSSSATGITIDDVCVELPYKNVTVRDIAVSDVSKLETVDKVSVVYGGEFMTEADVVWGSQENGSNVVYGVCDELGLAARAVITDSALKVRVTQSGVTTEETALEYGKAVTAEGNNEMVFLIDSLEEMNLISSVAGTGIYAEPVKGTASSSVQMLVRDNGGGVTVEGVAQDAADNDKIIIIKDSDGMPARAAYAGIGSDGGYAVEIGSLATGKYTAAMCDTGISAEFSYATAGEYEELRNKINSGSAEALLEDETNRMILGASAYDQLDRLSSKDKSKVYSEFKEELGNKTRAQAAVMIYRAAQTLM